MPVILPIPQDRIVGISGFTVRPPEARRTKPKVSAFTSATHEKILALEPDLVLGFSDLQADIAAELVRRGANVHIANHRSVAGILDQILLLLQKNVLNGQRWATREELRIAIVTWIERTYHRRRRQPRLGRLTPIEYETIMSPPAAIAA